MQTISVCVRIRIRTVHNFFLSTTEVERKKLCRRVFGRVPQQLFRNLTGTVPVPTKQHLAYHHAELGVLISSGMGASVGQESSPCTPHAPFPLAAPPTLAAELVIPTLALVADRVVGWKRLPRRTTGLTWTSY